MAVSSIDHLFVTESYMMSWRPDTVHIIHALGALGKDDLDSHPAPSWGGPRWRHSI